MAIKGKSGSRGRRRSGGAPKPVPVVVRTPLLARRSTWLSLGVTAALLIGLASWSGLRESAAAEREAEITRREAAVTRAISGDIEAALSDLGFVGEPDILGLPKSFVAAVDAAVADPTAVTSAASTADQLLAALATSRTALEPIDVAARVRGKGLGELFVLRLIQARQRLLDGLDLYRAAATIAAGAANLEGEAQAAAVGSASDVAAQAAAAVADGWQNLVEAQVMAGTYVPPTAP